MAYTTDASDSFNRADGALGGSTLDNASGGIETVSWQNIFGPDFAISGNKAVNANSIARHIAGVNTSATGDMRVSMISYLVGAGPVARLTGTTACYLFYRDTSASYILVDAAGAGSFSVLGTGGAISDGQEMAIVCNGSTITAEVDGVTTITAPPDTAIASGKPGLYSDGGGPGADSWKYQTGTASVVTPTQLVIGTAPVGNQSGVNFTTQPVVRVADAGASTVTSDTSTVTATLNTLSGSGTLGGTTSVAAVAGVATFTNLKITGTGSFTLTFSDGALATVTTGTLYVGATQLAITTAPTTAFSKHATTIVVTAKDGGGTAVGNYTGTVAVTLNKLSGAGSVATLTGGTSSAAAVAGVATLTPIATTSDNGLVATSYTYTAAASGLTSATTATITPTVSESIAVTIT